MPFAGASLLFAAVAAFGNPAFHASVSVSASPELTGVVTDIAHVPIPDVEITMVKPGGNFQATTTQDGRFTLKGLPSGNISVKFRRLGYEVRTIEIAMNAASQTVLDVVLKPIPEELEAMLINSEERDALREFYEHKKQRSSYGKFYTAEDIRKRGVTYPSDLFRNLPGVRLTASPFSGSMVRIRGCQPMLWMDGQRVPNSEVDEVASPSDIAGLEFYPSMAGTPPQYLDRSTRACGAIIVWTKNR
jgi:hypothetical protein